MVRDKAKALKRLQAVLVDIPRLKQKGRNSPFFARWKKNAKAAIGLTFGEKSSKAIDFERIWVSFPGISEDEYREKHFEQLGAVAALVKLSIEEIEKDWPDAELVRGRTAKIIDWGIGLVATRKVFIAHGRDETAIETMESFVKKLDLKPIILSQQPSQGKTIIEKFEANSNVSYAIALLTGDDIGTHQGDNGPMRPRARQNVIFELGFFIGKLGRKRVCVLTKGDPEIPSDYSGVVYIPMDEGGTWRGELVKELKAAMFDVDANLLYD